MSSFKISRRRMRLRCGLALLAMVAMVAMVAMAPGHAKGKRTELVRSLVRAG